MVIKTDGKSIMVLITPANLNDIAEQRGFEEGLHFNEPQMLEGLIERYGKTLEEQIEEVLIPVVSDYLEEFVDELTAEAFDEDEEGE